MSITPDDAAAPDFDIFDWIETGTVAQRSVVLYNDPEIVGEFEELERRLAAADKAAKAGTGAEASIGETSESVRILEQMEALHARWEASKATWWVRALSPDEVKSITAEFPDPVRPDIPKEASAEARSTTLQAFLDAQQAAVDERNLRYVSTGVVRVETPRGTATSVPVEALRKMRAKPHGPARLNALLTAVNEATNGDVTIPAPKSLGSSKGSQG